MSDRLFDALWEAILRLEMLGFKVLALTCDGLQLWKLHCKDDSKITYKVPNPYASDSHQLYFISDPLYISLKQYGTAGLTARKTVGKQSICQYGIVTFKFCALF